VWHMPMLIHHASHFGACLASSQTPLNAKSRGHSAMHCSSGCVHTRAFSIILRQYHHVQLALQEGPFLGLVDAGGRPPPRRSRIAPRHPIARAAHASMKTFFLVSVEQVYLQAEVNLLATAQAYCLGEAPVPNAKDVV